jgi:Ca2+-binding RTX toxin-like protein
VIGIKAQAQADPIGPDVQGRLRSGTIDLRAIYETEDSNMELKTVTHFSHGGVYSKRNVDDVIAMIEGSGSDGIRDGLNWGRVEEKRGHYEFSGFRNSYISQVENAGLNVTLTLMPGGNPLYNGGKTVISKKDIAAFADYVVAVAKAFPEVDTIVIGNEFNGLNSNFINGGAATKNIDKRVKIYTNIVEEVNKRLDAADLDVQLSGGALHSVATGYVQAMIKAGTFRHIDTLDFHPYGANPVEVANSLQRLNTVLSDLPEAIRPTLMVTEFGASADPDDPLSNSDYLAKMVAVLADGGVETAAWYAFFDDDRGQIPDMGLYDDRTTPNDMLDGYRFVAGLLDAGAAPSRVDTGPGIELYDFGNGTWLVWGSVQNVTFTGTDLQFFDTCGRPIDPPAGLSDQPVYVQGKDITLTPLTGDGALLADSFYDFALSPDPDGPWSYHALKIKNGRESVLELELMDGQTKMSESWNPYLGQSYSRPLQITADSMVPAGFGTQRQNDRAPVERFTAEADGALDIVGVWTVGAGSKDGVILEIRLNGETLSKETITSGQVVALRALEMLAGDTVDFIIHDGVNATGDYVSRHIRVMTADADLTTDDLITAHLAGGLVDVDVKTNRQPIVIDQRPEDPGEDTDPDSGSDPEPFFDQVHHGTNCDDKLVATRKALADVMFGKEGDDTLNGQKGNDLLDGGSGDDMLMGKNGDDSLSGGTGNDTLTGGAGADVFVFTDLASRDVVKDFDTTEGDRLDLTALDLSPDDLLIRQDGRHTELLVRTDAEDMAIALLHKLDASSLDADGVILL